MPKPGGRGGRSWLRSSSPRRCTSPCWRRACRGRSRRDGRRHPPCPGSARRCCSSGPGRNARRADSCDRPSWRHPRRAAPWPTDRPGQASGSWAGPAGAWADAALRTTAPSSAAPAGTAMATWARKRRRVTSGLFTCNSLMNVCDRNSVEGFCVPLSLATGLPEAHHHSTLPAGRPAIGAGAGRVAAVTKSYKAACGTEAILLAPDLQGIVSDCKSKDSACASSKH